MNIAIAFVSGIFGAIIMAVLVDWLGHKRAGFVWLGFTAATVWISIALQVLYAMS